MGLRALRSDGEARRRGRNSQGALPAPPGLARAGQTSLKWASFLYGGLGCGQRGATRAERSVGRGPTRKPTLQPPTAAAAAGRQGAGAGAMGGKARAAAGTDGGQQGQQGRRAAVVAARRGAAGGRTGAKEHAKRGAAAATTRGGLRRRLAQARGARGRGERDGALHLLEEALPATRRTHGAPLVRLDPYAPRSVLVLVLAGF